LTIYYSLGAQTESGQTCYNCS